MTILAAGEALYDVFQVGEPSPGALTLDARFGGSALNVAVALARLGEKTALFTGISTDAFGQRLMARLSAEGVDTGYLVYSERPTTLSVITTDSHGQPAYTFYGRESADTGLTAAEVPGDLSGVRAVHVGSYACVLEPVGSAMLALAEQCAGRFLSFDPNVRLTIDPDVTRWRARIGRFRRMAALVKVSAEDLRLLYPDAAPLEVAADWAGDGAGLVVLTNGPADIVAFFQGRVLRAAPPPVAVVDTVGAGDTVQAALLSGLRQAGAFDGGLGAVGSGAMQDILDRAAKAGAYTCARRGMDPPGRDAL